MSELPTHPAPRAPGVIDQRSALERELADLKLQIADRALAAYEGQPDGREKLAQIVANIRTIEFQLECNGLAHDLAKRLDREARAEWRRQIESDPRQATEGVTKKKCCGLCSEANGCIITGDACAHPIMVGGVGPQHQGNPAVRALFTAASKHLKIGGVDWSEEDDTDDEGEYEDDDEEGDEEEAA